MQRHSNTDQGGAASSGKHMRTAPGLCAAAASIHRATENGSWQNWPCCVANSSSGFAQSQLALCLQGLLAQPRHAECMARLCADRQQAFWRMSQQRVPRLFGSCVHVSAAAPTDLTPACCCFCPCAALCICCPCCAVTFCCLRSCNETPCRRYSNSRAI